MSQAFLLTVYLIALFGSSFVLIKSTDILIASLTKISQITKIGRYTTTAIILGLATSLPELFVGIVSALEGRPSLSLGNVIGSNIANLSLVIGGAAIIAGSLKVKKDILNKDLIISFAIATLPVLFLIDGALSRVEGLILILVYVFYNLFLIRNRHQKHQDIVKENFVTRIFRRLFPKDVNTRTLYRDLLLGIILLLFSADMIVKISIKIAVSFNIPIFFIGIFLVAVGTSLPELTFGIRALSKGQSSMAIGNILGSIVVNSSLVLGLTSFLHPITISRFNDYLLAFIFSLIIFSFFYIFVKTKKTLENWEGAVLILIYIYFILLEFLKRWGFNL